MLTFHRASSRMQCELLFQDGKQTQSWLPYINMLTPREGRELQFDYWPKWQWKVKYLRLNMLRLRDHKYDHSSRTEFTGMRAVDLPP